MEHGFIKVAAVTPSGKVADTVYNREQICECIREASEEIGLNLDKKDLTFLGCFIEHFESDHEIVYVYICDLENPIFKLGEEVTEIIPLPISSLMSKQDKLCFTDEHLQPRIISREMICPHDLSLVDEYLKNKLA